ncbi:MAG: HPr family phosphocarrier protein [Oscillospiraceae bacterium]|nr:HPr family phosphocarrier protein [Oscillospiraceae bacterium]
MPTFFVYLSSIHAVKEFVTIASQFDFDICVLTERHRTNAKSIMALFSLDLSKPLEIAVDGTEAECSAFQEQISQFVAPAANSNG